MTRQNKIHREKVYVEMLIKSIRKCNQRVDANDICRRWHDDDIKEKKKK